MSDAKAVARAIDAIRRGWPVRVVGSSGAVVLLAVETADTGRLAAFDPGGSAPVLISGPRAAALRLGNQRDAAGTGPVLVERTGWMDLPTCVALADPASDLATPLKGPFRAAALPFPEAAAAALELGRLAGLLPAFFVREGSQAADAEAGADAIRAYESPESLAIAARARLPVAGADVAEIVAFRSPAEATEHVALLIGRPDGRPPLVRIHSECLTGDALGSLKCDCGPQLHAAIARMAAEGWGILLYLRQEGRGIGLVNKLRAYGLQDQGFDTVDANLRLGFAVDARDYRTAARMLRMLGQDSVRLLTNNPLKVAALTDAGVTVVERLEHQAGANAHNLGYLAAKRDRTGHLL